MLGLSGGGISRARTAAGLAALALAAGATGCGGGGGSSSRSLPGSTSAASPASTSATQSQPQVTAPRPPPVADLKPAAGPIRNQITATIVSFYRAAWQNQAALACSLFSSTGLAGFMHASQQAFPGSINRASTCTHAMQVFNAALADSVNMLQQEGVDTSGDALDKVGVQDVRAIDNFATAIAPVGVELIIKPKRISLVRLEGRWLIAGSHSLTTTPAQLLAEARANGELSSTGK
jgi:hypothetical protein